MIRFVLELIQGMLIGAGGILPGISGASLAVVFGFYEELTSLLAHPRRTLRTFLALHIPLLAGMAAGFAGCTLLLGDLFDSHAPVIVFLFSGFIAGTLPGIWKQARKHGSGLAEFLAFAIPAALMISMTFLSHGTANQAGPAAGAVAATAAGTAGILAPAGYPPGTWLFAGAIVGAGSLLPGISASFILIVLGLYGPLLDTVRNLEISVALQLAAGAAGAVILLSRLTNWLYRHFHGLMSFAILGFTLGSLVLAFPGLPEGKAIPASLALALAGLTASLVLGHLAPD